VGALEGKVIIVTGAANGIGRECALACARQGARVLVNDLGGDVNGREEGSAGPAEAVAEEIRQAGGVAVSNSDSVTSYASAEGMRDQALTELGGLHAVINPAGILRDGMFHKMSPENWRAVIDVHLHGAFNVTRATVEHFREQQDGAYVLFTSTSALIGTVGQANYAAAKLGVMGLSRLIAMEGASKNVRSNLISPFAWTRMVDAIPMNETSAPSIIRGRKMRADQVATFAAALCADQAKHVSGQIFAVRGNEIMLFNQPRPLRSMADPTGWTVDSILGGALPALKNSFTDLGSSADTIPYDPI
jgi:NAD(P)-dependent dehydrogenase (short-subunit alcohol dehydrogenase family)